MSNDQYILSHYKKVASAYGYRGESTIRDPFIRETEIDFILMQIFSFIKRKKRMPYVVDLGCGNGYTLSVLREVFPEMKLAGMEFTPELLNLAKNRRLDNCELVQGDLRVELPFRNYDIAITERVIINLLNKKNQEATIRLIMNNMKRDGHYIMIESFNEPLVKLNYMRKENGFDDITPSRHNRFLKEGLIDRLKRDCLDEIEGELPPNQLSTHFVTTRVLHPMIMSDESKRLNNRLVDFFVSGLKQDTGEYSPIILRVFTKK